MLTGEIQSQSLPWLQPDDTIGRALQLMSDNQVFQLPVVEGDKYAGMVTEDDLLQVENDGSAISALPAAPDIAAVRQTDHFLRALQLAATNNWTVVPVVDEENRLVSVVGAADLLRCSADFLSLNQPGALIVLEMEGIQFSFNEISKLVETNDAQITQLNTSTDTETGMLQVTIKVNKPEVSDIVATFQRYEYSVKYYFGEEIYTNELRDNYENLMNYLKF
ncbi:MAG: CBS domain-containing protein [Chitinophagaceae bacterium]